jgi:riboflavin synthase
MSKKNLSAPTHNTDLILGAAPHALGLIQSMAQAINSYNQAEVHTRQIEAARDVQLQQIAHERQTQHEHHVEQMTKLSRSYDLIRGAGCHPDLIALFIHSIFQR